MNRVVMRRIEHGRAFSARRAMTIDSRSLPTKMAAYSVPAPNCAGSRLPFPCHMTVEVGLHGKHVTTVQKLSDGVASCQISIIGHFITNRQSLVREGGKTDTDWLEFGSAVVRSVRSPDDDVCYGRLTNLELGLC